MSLSFRNALFLTASAGAIAAAGAHAQTVNGGGSTLASPVYQQIFNSDLTPPPTYNYYPSGSGAAQTAFLNNTISSFGAPGVTTGAVHYGASDATLTATQISTFSTTYGYPLIQVPSFGTPITLPFKVAGKTTSGSIVLSDAVSNASGSVSQVCGVFSGKITDFHDIDATIPAGSTIKVQYRADNSGTTFLLTQHLAAVCNATNSNFFATGNKWATTAPAATTSFASLFGTVPANFTGQTGSAGVEAGVNATSNSIGYLSPDFTRIAAINSANTSFPVVAAVSLTQAGTTVVYQPTTSNTTAALNGAKFPAFDAAGVAHPTTTLPSGTVATNPANWIPTNPNPTTGYPIVGYTTIEASSCYDSSAVGDGVIKFLNSLYDATGASPFTTTAKEIPKRGFTLVPGASISAAPTAGSFAADIVSTFLTGTGALRIDHTGCPAPGAAKPGR